jgi:hypothetical protein
MKIGDKLTVKPDCKRSFISGKAIINHVYNDNMVDIRFVGATGTYLYSTGEIEKWFDKED